MSKLKSSIDIQTAFGEYRLLEQLGEGGAGRVYGGTDATGAQVAIKVLTNVTTDKRRRFKNEIAFLARNQHPNIVTVTDHGVATQGKVTGPFYVMRRYESNLRDLIKKGLSPSDVLAVFSRILDGVEAAHLTGAVHRDLKPENILADGISSVAVADFGVASFTEDQLVTLVETAPTQRLANFQYAAPEQRVLGKTVSSAVDIYALGLILNEMFTRTVPHGTDYQTIANVVEEYKFLDEIVARMIKQNPSDRPKSIMEAKQLIQRHHSESVSLQRLSSITNTVVKIGEIDDPLAHDPPVLVGASWKDGKLTLTLDRPVSSRWVHALQNMGSYSAAWGADPSNFSFHGTNATIQVDESYAQAVIDHFKVWLPKATQVMKYHLEQQAKQEEAQQREQLRRARELEERNLRVNQALRI